MKLLGAKLRGIFAKFSEALPPSFAKATQQAARYSAKENKKPMIFLFTSSLLLRTSHAYRMT
jgi:hypothetical protein